MHRYFVIAVILLLYPLIEGRACESNTIPLQSKALAEFKGAIRHLSEAMRCLQRKRYPDDINVCGISSFGSELELNQVELCLASQVPKSVRALGPQNKNSGPQKIALLIDCSKKNVLVVFKMQGDEFFVDGINFLLD